MAKSNKSVSEPSNLRTSGVKGQQTRPRSRPGSGDKPAPRPSGNTRPQARNTNKSTVTKTPASTNTTRVSGTKQAPARPRSRSESGQNPFQSTRDAMAERRTPVNAAPSGGPNRPTTRPRARPNRDVTYAQWSRMSREERREKGLPLSDMPEASWREAMARR